MFSALAEDERLHPPIQERCLRFWQKAIIAGIYHSPLLPMAREISSRFEISSESKLGIRRAVAPKLAVLCYHRVGTRGLPIYSALPAKVFAEQIEYIRKHFRVLSVADLCDELQRPRSAKPAVAITFDDGYSDLFEQAFPTLQRYAIPATIFLAVDAIESGEVPWYDRIFAALQLLPGPSLQIELDTIHDFRLGSPAARLEVAEQIMRILRILPDEERNDVTRDLERRVVIPKKALSGRMLTWDQIRIMHRAGISFGSHTLSHPIMARIPFAEAERELKESRAIIEQRLGIFVDTFAFPFGQPSDIDGISPEILKGCGYRCAMTTIEGVNHPGISPYRIKRTQICNEWSIPMFAWKLSQYFMEAS